MQMHESIYKYMHIVHSITCIKAISMRLHVSMQISAWMCISSLAYGGKRVPPILHQSETCYVHHSLADIDTKKLLTGEINQAVWWPNWPFFKIGQSCCLRLFCRSLTAELSWSGLVKDPIGNWHNARIYAFWVALINNWWLHGRWEIQFLAEWLREDNVISIGSLFSTAHNSSSCNAAVKLGSRSQVWEGRQSQHGADQEQTKKSFSGFFSHSFPLSFAIKVWPRLKSKKRGGLRHLRGRSAISALFPIQTLILFPTELIHNSTV